MTRIQHAMSARMDRIRKGEGDKGFTLIELLVVIIIIGILAAIAIPVFLNFRESAWKLVGRVRRAQRARSRSSATRSRTTAPVGFTAVTQSEGNTIAVPAATSPRHSYVITGSNANLHGSLHLHQLHRQGRLVLVTTRLRGVGFVDAPHPG